MKVLTLSHLYPNDQNPISGLFVAQQVEELTRQGCTNKVVSPIPWVPFFLSGWNRKWRGLKKIPGSARINGVKVLYPRFPVLPKKLVRFLIPFSYYLFVNRLVKRTKKNYPFELLHAHTALPDGYAAMLTARKLKLPFVVTIHGYDLDPANLRSRVWRRMLKTVIGRADKVIYVSSYLEKIAKEQLGTGGNSTIIFNGIAFPPVEFGEQVSQELVILSVANLIPRKGIDILIQAFSLAAKAVSGQAVLRIIGDGPERKRLEQLTEELGLKDKVVFLGRKPNTVVSREMASCNIFCLPSWHEGFGVVYLEAMAYGKPVIGCKDQGIEDGITDGVNGFLVRERDVPGLAACLKKLMTNPDLRAEIGRAGRNTVQDKFTLAKEAADLKKLYNLMLKGIP